MPHDNKPGILQDRVLSIDALRGFDMFWIIGGGAIFGGLHTIFNNPATAFINSQLKHAEWEGFRFEDLIFPLFLFIVGLVLPFSISHRTNRAKLFLHIIKRSALLIFLGLLLNGLLQFDFPNMRWPGVLQRIGLCYFFAAIIVMCTSWRTQASLTTAILVLYYLATTLIPVPNFGPGVITMQGCLSSYIDRLLLPGSLYYGFGDNEGLLSTLPAVSTVLIGALAGHWLRSNRSGNKKAAWLVIAAVVSLAAGYVWGLFFPIIKINWTSSYVLVAAGWSLLLLALFYWIIDVKGFKKWPFFFIVIGANPITIYFLQRVVDFNGIANFFAAGIAGHLGVFASLLLALSVLMIKWLFLRFLYHRKIFFKV